MEDLSITSIKSKSKIWLEKMHKLLNTNFDRAFGLDISDKSIEIAELSKLFRFSLENHGGAELPEGVIKDGRIWDEKVLAENIKLLLQNVQPRHVSTNKVILSLPESQVFSHHFVINTPLTGASLRVLVQKEISKIMPINPSKMYWDIKVKGQNIFFMGISKDIAESYVRVCNSIGLDVVAFGVEPLSIARLLMSPEDNNTVIVDIGTHTTDVSVVKGNDELKMTITIPIGGRDMTTAIAQGLNVDEATAEAKKVAVGSGTSDELFFLMEPVVKNISQEVSRVIAYFENTFNEKTYKILLVGGASMTGGVREKISEVIEKPVESIQHFNNFENQGIISPNVPVSLYTSVIGLAMLGASNEFENMNLLRQMPPMHMNSYKKTELFNSGYLSKGTALRIILNSRLTLVIAIALCAGSFMTFGYLWFNYTMNQTYQVKDYKTSKITPKAISGSLNFILNSLNAQNASSSVTSSTTIKKI